MNPGTFFTLWLLLQTPGAGAIESDGAITTWTCEQVEVEVGIQGTRCEFIWTPPAAADNRG